MKIKLEVFKLTFLFAEQIDVATFFLVNVNQTPLISILPESFRLSKDLAKCWPMEFDQGGEEGVSIKNHALTFYNFTNHVYFGFEKNCASRQTN